MTPGFSDRIDEIPPSGIRRFFDLVIGHKDIISLGVGEPDFVTPWTIREDAIYSIEQGYTTYTGNQGLPELLDAISSHLNAQFSVHYDTAEILTTVGVSEGVDITLRSILNPGDEVILPEPGYVCYSPLIHLAGGTTISIDTSGTQFIPDPKAIEKAITPRTKALILCSPNNPTGAVIPKPVLLEIAKLAKRYNFWVISDEIYARLNYGHPYTSFTALPGMKNHTVLLGGFSKSHAMTGWRLGYLCGPEAIVKRALKIHQYSILCAPILSQYAAIEALKSGDKSVEDMRKSYERRRNLFVEGLNKIGLKTSLPEGAFYCFVDIRSTGLSSEEFAIQLLQKFKVAVVPGHVFGLGGEGYVRCCYATEVKLLKEALKRIDAFLIHLKESA